MESGAKQQDAEENGDTGANQPAKTDEEKRNRDKLWVMFKKWDEHVMRAMKEYNDEIDRRHDLFLKEQRDIAIRADRKKKAMEEAARSAQRHEAWRRSLRGDPDEPTWNQKLWAQVTEGLAYARPVATTNNGTGNNTQSATASSRQRSSSFSWWPRPTQSGTVSSAGSAPAPRARAQPPPPPPPPPQLEETTWDEDEVDWLLGELNRPNRRPGDLEACAETLDRTVQEVIAEKERLKRAGRYRSPARR